MDLGDLAEKWKSFNWNVHEMDGHDFEAIHKGINEAKAKNKNGNRL